MSDSDESNDWPWESWWRSTQTSTLPPRRGRAESSRALPAQGGASIGRTSAAGPVWRWGEGSPIAFYERYGFRRTGDIVFDDEVLLRLRLRRS